MRDQILYIGLIIYRGFKVLTTYIGLSDLHHLIKDLYCLLRFSKADFLITKTPLPLNMIARSPQDLIIIATILITKLSLDQMDYTITLIRTGRSATTSLPRKNTPTNKSSFDLSLSSLITPCSKYLNSHLKSYRCKANNTL